MIFNDFISFFIFHLLESGSVPALSWTDWVLSRSVRWTAGSEVGRFGRGGAVRGAERARRSRRISRKQQLLLQQLHIHSQDYSPEPRNRLCSASPRPGDPEDLAGGAGFRAAVCLSLHPRTLTGLSARTRWTGSKSTTSSCCSCWSWWRELKVKPNLLSSFSPGGVLLDRFVQSVLPCAHIYFNTHARIETSDRKLSAEMMKLFECKHQVWAENKLSWKLKLG